MPPKIDPNELKILKLKTMGGEVGAASTLAPKMGPLGLNAKKVGEDIQKETAKWKGIKIMIELRCQNRAATIVIVPSASALLIAELGAKTRVKKKGGKGEKHSAEGIKHDGNLTLEQVVKVARVMHPRSLSKEFKGTVKQILGTAQSLGCTVMGDKPRNIIEKITNGLIDVPSA